MEKVNFGYSMKNIPIPPRSGYTQRLIEMTEKLTQRMRWKAYFFLNPDKKPKQTETFGFKTRNMAPHIKELTNFEQDMTQLIQNIKFKPHNNPLQTKLKQDTNQIKTGNKVLVKADKTTNFYKLDSNDYNKLLHENITKTYKKAEESIPNKITKKDKATAQRLGLENKVEKLAEKQAFITLKDHKDNFQNHPTCRLINPTKSEIGKISKTILTNINKQITKETKVNLWRSTSEVIDWFKNIEDKSKSAFISFDVCEFYPSITEKLLDDALNFATNLIDITDEDRDIIMHTKQALLFHEGQPWAKKDNDSLFDITMGSYDGAETCELVGTYLLTQLPEALTSSIGLYRDDGLAICKGTPREIEKTKKTICKIFKQNNLKITIEANKQIINFLDVTLNLKENNYKPYLKPGNTILYVNKHSNHPSTILKNIPENINNRLSNLASDEQQFKNTVQPYQDALTNSGYNYKLHYNPSKGKANKRTRQRNVTWYNPPFSANVLTNLGKKFLNIVQQCFPTKHPLHKLFNRNTMKLSYSCMPNMKSIIDAKNKKLTMPKTTNNNEKTCNCRQKDSCPLAGKCRSSNLIYQASVKNKTNQSTETYIGLCSTEFKSRYTNHKASFNHRNKQNQTELSKHVWGLKDSAIEYDISWKIISQAQPYSNKTKRCNLCILEKFYIICKPQMCTLNKRQELSSHCRHAKSYLLGHIK